MSRVKICGLRRMEDVQAVNEARPDYAGFVFAKSPRQVTAQQAAVLRTGLSPSIVPVGVFVNEKQAVIEQLYRDGVIAAAQLHGQEDAAYLRSLKRDTGLFLIRAVRVRDKADVEQAQELAPETDLLLLDSGAGSGLLFNWDLLRGFSGPYLLAGGLDAENVQKAIRLLHPFGVDVSSGVETNGFKDPGKIAEFVRRARNVEG